MAPRATRASARASETTSNGNVDDATSSVCAVCKQENSRVTVACGTCTHVYHLNCHAPPLRRRPPTATTWQCATCEGNKGKLGQDGVEDEEDEDEDMPKKRRVTREVQDGGARKRRRGTNNDDVEDGNVEDDVTAKSVTSRRSTRTRDVQDIKDVKDESVVKEETKNNGKRKAPLSVKKGKQPMRRTPIKIQEPELSAKRGARAAARGRHGSSKAKKVTGDDDDLEADDDHDDDDDSDYEDASAAEDEESDKEELSDASDDDFEAPIRFSARPTPKSKQKQTTPKKAPASKKARAKKTRDGAGADENVSHGGNAAPTAKSDDEDSMAPAVEADGDLVEEVYTGPRYFIEYAVNARAKCKDCEEKLPRDELRVGVVVRHSMFGITTYFKHVKCTQICWGTRLLKKIDDDAEQEPAPDSDVTKDGENGEDEPISGFKALKPKDQAAVRAHMEKNAELGLLDERLELSEDHYNRKTRMPEKEPSAALTVPLLPYQREALAWMTAQETSDYKGGILADEMGMGKTIQSIALILENPRGGFEDAIATPPVKFKGRGGMKASAETERVVGGTLVICPLVAVMQWKSEIERFVERDHLSIYIHHGSKRVNIIEKIASYDIVLTTYSIIESEVRQTLLGERIPCKYCKKKYLPDKLIQHNKYFCGPNAKKTKLQDKQQSKKNSKKKAAGEDSESDDDDLKKPAKRPVMRGKKQKKVDSDSDDNSDDDDPTPARQVKKTKSPLHQIYWTRIVLDEAHYIKDRRCNTARGVFELKSEYKWCLTGTPLQNRIGELFSLIRFLQVKFFSYYHCSKCECQKLDFDFPNGKCALCPHPAMHHYSYFNKKIVVPIQSYGYVAEGKIAMLRLQNEVLQHILLRRTKEGRADDISLPPKLVRVRRDRLDERENDFYQAIYTQSQAQFNTYVSSGTLLNNYAHIFDLLIRLRQAVDHPYLVIYSKSNPAVQVPVSMDGTPLPGTSSAIVRPVVEQKPLVAIGDGDGGDQQDERPCGICHEDVEDVVTATCSHEFCRECVKEFIESLPDGAEAMCPTCDKPLTVDLAPPKTSDDDEEEPADPHRPIIRRAQVNLARYHKHSILHRISDLNSFQTSTKIEALMQELDHMQARDPSGKAIVFSQFVNMLDIVQHRLTLGGIQCVKLSGNMSMDVRDRTIRAFRENNDVKVFLISLKAGGVALNLTIASHIFLMDPWWNPAAENQAIDRTHRLGQFKPIQATRFIIAGTIEERILKLQEKKRLIFEGTVGASVSAISRLTEEDLRFLFSS